MLRDKNYWEPIYDMFCQDYPGLAKDMVDWYPSGQMEIVVKTKDGSKYSYDSMNRIGIAIYDADEENVLDNEDVWRQQFGVKLKNKMRKVAITQNRLACETGVSQVMISRYINGAAMPSAYILYKIAKVLKCSPTELLDI